MDFKISESVTQKLKTKHNVAVKEVVECFLNRTGCFFSDSRMEHQTNPPTYWFVAETDKGRTLKVVFVRHSDFFEVKTAYQPTDGSDKLYARLSAKHK